jgi:hypothetical protein
MMAMTLQAAWQIVRGRARVFERTPKFGITRRNDGWVSRSYQHPLEALLVIEGLIALWAIATMTYAWSGPVETRLWALYPGLMASGALFVVALTIVQRFQARAAHRRGVSRPVRV